MDAMQKALILKFGAPIMTNIVESMLSDGHLVKYRDAAMDFMRRVARKSNNTLDDMAVEIAIEFIMRPENYIKYGHGMIIWAQAYVRESSTKWDDVVFLPLLQRLETICVGLEE